MRRCRICSGPIERVCVDACSVPVDRWFAGRPVGRRRLFAVGLAVFTLGSLACGLADGALTLVLARAGQGVGGAIMFATSLALIAQAFRGRERALAFGLLGAITGVAVAIGPVLGGVLTSDSFLGGGSSSSIRRSACSHCS